MSGEVGGEVTGVWMDWAGSRLPLRAAGEAGGESVGSEVRWEVMLLLGCIVSASRQAVEWRVDFGRSMMQRVGAF